MKTPTFLILTHFFLFLFLFWANILFSQEKYNPSPEFKEFVQIDLEKELITHKINKENGLAYKYTPNMLNEFQKKFFPKERIQWFQPKEAPSSYFYFKGESMSSENKKHQQETHVSWKSDADRWDFSVTKISRIEVKENNFFEIIGDKKIIKDIKKQINYKKNDKIDVFLHEDFTFDTDKETENIPFSNLITKYNCFGVYYNSKLYFFNKRIIFLDLEK